MISAIVKKGLMALAVLAALSAGVIDSAAAAARDVNIVFIPKARDQEFWIFMREGVDRAIRESGGIVLTWRGPAYNDHVDAQIEILKRYTTQDVDAIILAPTDRARLVEPVRQAVALGIKVIVVDSPLDGSDYLNFIGTDNFAAGMLAAQHLSSLLNGQGEVAVIRTVAGSGSTDERADGFVHYLKKHAPRITIVANEYAGGTRGKAFHVSADLLKKLPQLDGIFAVNESASDGMLRALRQAGLAGKKKFVGFDSTGFLLSGLEHDEIGGLIVQDPRQMGYLALKAALAAVSGNPVHGRTVFIDAVLVTQGNYRKPEIQVLLIP